MSQQTGSTLLVGLVAGVSAVVGFLSGVLGSALVDRVSPSRLLPLLDWGRAIVMAALAGLLLGDTGHLWLVYPAVGINAAMTALYVPAAQRLIADVEPPERLVRANASFQALYGIGGVLGFGGAGLLYPLGGISFALLIDAVTFAIAGSIIAYFCRGIRRPAPDQGAEENDYWQDVITGARYLASIPALRYLVLLSIGAVTALAPIDVLGPSVAGDLLQRPVWMLAVLEVGVMSGRIVGSLAARRLSVTRPLFVVASVLAIMCVSSGLVSAFATVLTAPVSYTVMGICASLAAVAVTTGIQQLAQPAIRGRVLALQGAGMTVVPTLGVLLIAQLSDVAGPRVAFAVIAAMLAALALLARIADQRVLLAS